MVSHRALGAGALVPRPAHLWGVGAPRRPPLSPPLLSGGVWVGWWGVGRRPSAAAGVWVWLVPGLGWVSLVSPSFVLGPLKGPQTKGAVSSAGAGATADDAACGVAPVAAIGMPSIYMQFPAGLNRGLQCDR